MKSTRKGTKVGRVARHAFLNTLPTSQELKQNPKWPDFKAILDKNDVSDLHRQIKALVSHTMEVYGAKTFETPREFVLSVIRGFMVFYASPEWDELREIDEIVKILKEIRSSPDVQDVYERRHAMIDELKAAGATWPMVAAMLTQGWDELEEIDKQRVYENLKRSHSRYNKEHGIALPRGRKSSTHNNSGGEL